MAKPLSASGFQKARNVLGIGAAELWTVLSVETKGCGFLPDRRPVIVFERHVFHQQTAGAFDAAHPEISSATPGGYLGGAREYERLDQAMALNRIAALNSASWGIGQVMGFNAGIAGFAGVEEMVDAMQDGEDAQLGAVANFLKARKLGALLKKHDWAGFAKGYNGPDFKKNLYDARLAGAFAGFVAGVVPDLRVRTAQVLLMFAGFDVGAIDGIAGKRTRSAVAEFRQQRGLPVSNVIDEELIKELAPT